MNSVAQAHLLHDAVAVQDGLGDAPAVQEACQVLAQGLQLQGGCCGRGPRPAGAALRVREPLCTRAGQGSSVQVLAGAHWRRHGSSAAVCRAAADQGQLQRCGPGTQESGGQQPSGALDCSMGRCRSACAPGKHGAWHQCSHKLQHTWHRREAVKVNGVLAADAALVATLATEAVEDSVVGRGDVQ